MQLHHLKDCVPEKDKVFVETSTSIEDFWMYMKSEYGKTEDLIRDLLKRLSKYAYPKEAKTDHQKFTAMYHVFLEMHTDMYCMGMLRDTQSPSVH